MQVFIQELEYFSRLMQKSQKSTVIYRQKSINFAKNTFVESVHFYS